METIEITPDRSFGEPQLSEGYRWGKIWQLAIGVSTPEVVSPSLTHEADYPSHACEHSRPAHDEL